MPKLFTGRLETSGRNKNRCFAPALQIMAVRILRKEKSGNVAFALKKTYWKTRWTVVVYHCHGGRMVQGGSVVSGKFEARVRPAI